MANWWEVGTQVSPPKPAANNWWAVGTMVAPPPQQPVQEPSTDDWYKEMYQREMALQGEKGADFRYRESVEQPASEYGTTGATLSTPFRAVGDVFTGVTRKLTRAGATAASEAAGALGMEDAQKFAQGIQHQAGAELQRRADEQAAIDARAIRGVGTLRQAGGAIGESLTAGATGGLPAMAGYFATDAGAESLAEADEQGRTGIGKYGPAAAHAAIEGAFSYFGGKLLGAGTGALAQTAGGRAADSLAGRAIKAATEKYGLSKPLEQIAQIAGGAGGEVVEELATETAHYLADKAEPGEYQGPPLLDRLKAVASVAAVAGGGGKLVSSLIEYSRGVEKGEQSIRDTKSARDTLAAKVANNEPVSRKDLERAGIPSGGTNAASRVEIARKELAPDGSNEPQRPGSEADDGTQPSEVPQGPLPASPEVAGDVGGVAELVQAPQVQPPAPAPEQVAPQPQTSPQNIGGLFGGMGKGVSDNLYNAWRQSLASSGQLPSTERQSNSIPNQFWEKVLGRGYEPNQETIDKFIDVARYGSFGSGQSAKSALDKHFPVKESEVIPSPVADPVQPPETLPQTPVAPDQQGRTGPAGGESLDLGENFQVTGQPVESPAYKITPQAIRKTFPGAKIESLEDGSTQVALRNGAKIQVVSVPNLKPSDEYKARVRSRYPNISDEQWEQAEAAGLYHVVGRDSERFPVHSLIALSQQLADETTLPHEAVHAARALGLFTDKEWGQLSKRYAKDATEPGVVEEAIAIALQQPAAKKLRTRIRTFIDKLLKSLGFSGFSPDVQSLLQDPEFWARGVQGSAGGDMMQPAWHGSPHRFEKFSTEKIGTGEGNQSFGWGIYLAGNREVAKYYRDRLSDRPGAGLSLAGHMPSSSDKAFSDAVWTAAKKLSEQLISPSGVVKSFGDLDIEGRRDVLAVVRRLLEDVEVRDAVVRLIPIDVMNMLAGKELSPDMLLHNPAMLVDLLPVNPDDSIAGDIAAMNVLAPAVALASAKVHTGLSRFDITPSDFFTAGGTLRHILPPSITSNIPQPSEFRKGSLYKVDLKPEEADYLLWDKPLSEQSEKVQKQLRAIDPDIWSAIDDALESRNMNPMSDDFGTYTGREFYNAIKHHDVHESLPAEVPGSSWYDGNTRDDKHASLWLATQGIRGIKYKDQGSRGSDGDSGTYNYVIFDDADVEIEDVQFQMSSRDPEVKRKLANIGTTEDVRKWLEDLDRAATEAGEPGKRADEQVEAEASQRFEADPTGERSKILDAASRGGQLNDADTVVAKKLFQQEAFEALKSGDETKLAEAAKLRDAYRATGTEQARAFRQRQDPLNGKNIHEATPEERLNAIVDDVYKRPPKEEKQREKAAKNGDTQKLEELDRKWARRLKKIEDYLNSLGLSLDQLPEIADDPVATARARSQISAAEATWDDKLYEYWQNSILSGPTTQAVNITGNVASGIWEFGVQRQVEALVNAGGFDKSGARPGEIPHIWRGLRRGVTEGLKNAMVTWKTELPVTQESKWDTARVAIGGKGGRIVRAMGWRPLGVADEFFNSLFSNLQVGAEAYRQAALKGLEGDDLADFIDAEVANRDSLSWRLARSHSAELTFQQEPEGITKSVRDIGLSLRKAPYLGRVARWFVPFVTFPVNATSVALRKAPVTGDIAIAKRAVDNWLNGRKPTFGMSRPAAERIIAWGLMTVLASSLDDDDPWITGSKTAPQGAPKNAIKIGDKWYEYGRVEPFATTLALMVDGLNTVKHGNADEIASAPIDLTLSQVADKTFLKGLADLMTVAGIGGGIQTKETPTNRVAGWAARFGEGFVPNFYRQTVEATRGERQETRTWGTTPRQKLAKTGERFAEGIEAPGSSTELKYDPWGRPIEKGTAPFWSAPQTDFVYRLLSPVQNTPNQPTVGDRIIAKFNNTSEKDYTLYPPDPYYTFNGKKYSMTGEQYEAFQRDSGELANKAVQAWMLEHAPNILDDAAVTQKQLDDLKQIISSARSAVRQQFIAREVTKDTRKFAADYRKKARAPRPKRNGLTQEKYRDKLQSWTVNRVIARSLVE